MTGRLSKLEQDLKTIETEVAELGAKLRERYKTYLDPLGESVYKQAIVAVYQLCTRSYPGEFLALSVANRRKLQEDIKSLSLEARNGLKQLGETPADRVTFATLESPADGAGNEPKTLFQTLLEKGNPEPLTEPIANPNALAGWCEAIEKSARDILTILSKNINHQLQQAYILPARLPDQILDMAIQADEAGRAIGSDPNLLNVLIDGGNSEEEDKEELIFPPKTTKITALHLRLAEIEFADSRLTIERNQLRSLHEQLDRIRDRYQRTHREYTIASAEAAWRGSWYD
jgi:hypothetical protein